MVSVQSLPKMMVSVKTLPELRAALKAADEGTGQVAQIIDLADVSIGERGFTTLIVTCGRMGSWRKAVEIFQAMALQNIRPNSYTYGALISVCCNSSKCDLAIMYFEEMKSAARENANCKPDARVYKNLVPTCVKHGKFDVVLVLYQEMIDTGVEADKQTLESVLEASWRRRRWDVAARLLDESHGQGKMLAPRTYTKLISACADHGDLDEALEFFLIMQVVGIYANTYSCRGLMRAIESAGRADMGIGLVNQMRKNDIFVSNETYNSLLRVLARRGEWSELINIVTEMRKLGIGISMESGAVITKCHHTQLGTCNNSTANIVASRIKGLGIAIDSDAQSWSIGVGSPKLSGRSDSVGVVTPVSDRMAKSNGLC